MQGTTEAGGSTATSRSTAVKIALVLTLAVVLLGAVRFGRYDWTGIPFERYPMTDERVVSEDCTEYIRPYTTESGRVIGPVAVDEQQYMSMVAHFRGVPRSELHVTCLLDPFATRPAVPWLASLLPLDEGAALGAVNLLMTVAATWAVVFTLRAQGFAGRAVAVSAGLFAVGWNTLLFSSALLIDAAVVCLVAVCWLLLAVRRPWWIWPVLLVSYPFKETVALVVLPVMAVWLWREWREERIGRGRAVGALAAAAGAAAVSVVVSRALLLTGDATWELAPAIGNLGNNLAPVGLAVFLIGTGPLFVPATLRIVTDVRTDGWWRALMRPEVVGLAVTAVLCFWVALAADLSPRFAWVGFPFAASLSCAWWSTGRPRAWIDRIPAPRWIDA